MPSSYSLDKLPLRIVIKVNVVLATLKTKQQFVELRANNENYASKVQEKKVLRTKKVEQYY